MKFFMIEVGQLFFSKFLMTFMIISFKKKAYLAREPKWGRKFVGQMYIEVGVAKITSNLPKNFCPLHFVPNHHILKKKVDQLH